MESDVLVLTNGEGEFKEFLGMRPNNGGGRYKIVGGVEDLHGRAKGTRIVRFGTYYLRKDYEDILRTALSRKFQII